MSASKMMHQDPSSCHVLKGACRKTSSGAGKNLPNRHPRKHRFHQMIRSAVSTTCMFVLALLCQTVQSAADDAGAAYDRCKRITTFKRIKGVFRNMIQQNTWQNCKEVILTFNGDYAWWENLRASIHGDFKEKVETVINTYIGTQKNEPILNAIQKSLRDFIAFKHNYHVAEGIDLQWIEQLQQNIEEDIEEDKRAAEEDAAKQEAERLRAAEEDLAKQEAEARTEFVDAMNFIAQPLLDLPSQKQSTTNLGRVLVKSPFDADNNHKGFLTVFKLEDDTHVKLVKAWEIYKRYKERKYTQNFQETGNKLERKEVEIPREIAEREQEKKIVIPDFLTTNENGLLLQFDALNGDHYIISNIRGLNDFGLNDFGSKGKQKKKWIQQVFKATGQLRFYKYTDDEIDPLKPEVVFEKVTRGRVFQFMISTQMQLNKKDETGAAKEFNITQDGGAEKVTNFIKAALLSCEE